MTAEVDHLLVLAKTLDHGVRWCETSLGVTPGSGGKHPLMGTENRLMSIASPAFPRAFLEILAVDPSAPAPNHTRWFDLDDPALLRSVEASPRLIHFVARTDDIHAAIGALRAQGLDPGPAARAVRTIAGGLLEWQITVREDGRRLFGGALPTLIQWGSVHPTESMAESGVTLQSVTACDRRADALDRAYRSLGLVGVAIALGPANLSAVLQTPRGMVTLDSSGGC